MSLSRLCSRSSFSCVSPMGAMVFAACFFMPCEGTIFNNETQRDSERKNDLQRPTNLQSFSPFIPVNAKESKKKAKKIFIISGTYLVLVSGHQLQPTHQFSRWAAGGETFFLVLKNLGFNHVGVRRHILLNHFLKKKKKKSTLTKTEARISHVTI